MNDYITYLKRGVCPEPEMTPIKLLRVLFEIDETLTDFQAITLIYEQYVRTDITLNLLKEQNAK